MRFKTDLIFFYAALVFSLVIVWPVLFPLALGITLAYVCEGPVDFLERKFHSDRPKVRWLSSFLVVLGITLVFAVPLVLFSITGIQQLVSLINGEGAETISLPSRLNEAVGWASHHLQGFGIELSSQDLVAKAKEWSGKVAEVLGSGAAAFLSATPTVLFDILLIYMAWFLFLVRGRQMRNMLIPFLLPWPREREIICKTTGDVIRSIIVSNVLVSMIQAFLVLLILFIAKVPHASLWAGMAFFMSFIPVVGTAPVVIGAGLFLYLNGHLGMAIFVGLASLLVATVDNFLRPLLVRGSVELSFFWVFIAFVGGIAQFGVAGSVLGPLAFSLFVAAYRALRTQEP